MTVGTNAFGYVVDSKTGTDLLLGTATNKLTASLGPDSVYAYSNDKNGYVYSNTDITTTGGKSYGLYTAGRTENYGNIDLTGGNGNVGIYSTGRSSAGLGAINYGTITVGGTDLVAKEYGIGMATGYYNETTGAISNEGKRLTDSIQKYIDEHKFAKGYVPEVKVVTSELKNDAGIIGAAFLYSVSD